MYFIINTKPQFVETKNSYERKIVYKALEHLELQHNIIVNCNRFKKWIPQIANKDMCSKHKCYLSGGCDCCSDPWCCGPNCSECGKWNICRYAVYEGDEMYKSKICVGVNLYYDGQKIKFKKIKFL
jgi:hypothetical protein